MKNDSQAKNFRAIDFSALSANSAAVQKSLQAFAERVNAQVKQINDALAKKLPGIQAGLARVRGDAIELANRGWTIAPWLTAREVANLCAMNGEDADAEFVGQYTRDDGSHLKKVLEALVASPLMKKWQPLMREVAASLQREQYVIAVPSLLLILEGYVSQFADPSRKRVTDIAKLMEQSIPQTESSVGAAVWESSTVFVSRLYTYASFDGIEPSFTNRHWILHGRSHADWNMADAIRLLNAINTLDWIMTRP